MMEYPAYEACIKRVCHEKGLYISSEPLKQSITVISSFNQSLPASLPSDINSFIERLNSISSSVRAAIKKFNPGFQYLVEQEEISVAQQLNI